MSIRNNEKDHLREHAGVELVAFTNTSINLDPLRFWSNHPTENALVDLHPFAEGVLENPSTGKWSGPFSGRPELIAELAPAIQARLSLASLSLCIQYKQALRNFWRVCDQVEATNISGRAITRITSVRDLSHLHEATMHQTRINNAIFGIILNIINDARRFMRIGPLMWTITKPSVPDRTLISDEMAKAIKIGIKRDWERVRKRWERHDSIRLGVDPDTLTELERIDDAVVFQYTEKNKVLRHNWVHFERIQKITGLILPNPDQLREGASRSVMRTKGLTITLMRSIAFPTSEEATIAFHSALMGSGWNPSTLVTGIDATLPNRIFQHPKDAKQSVLVVDEIEVGIQDNTENMEITMQGSKRRAGGRLQFCIGLKKNPDSPPMVVSAYLERTIQLREQLRQHVKKAQADLERHRAEGVKREIIECQFKILQTLQQGLRNVWLYVGKNGTINWIDGKSWLRFGSPNSDGVGQKSYLDELIERLNVKRAARFEPSINRIVPSDFRDIFARWVHLNSGGNIIAVMFALGHAGLKSTDSYIDNNIFNAENDEAVRNFMTHLFDQLGQGRVDLTILSQLVRHGPLTMEMQSRLVDYRKLIRSRIDVGCVDAKHPPSYISPDHVEGMWCGTHRCLRDCPNARFLPESVNGIARRVEELLVMSDRLPIDTWIKGLFQNELEVGEYLLSTLYEKNEVDKAVLYWREKINSGKHVVPGIGLISKEYS